MNLQKKWFGKVTMELQMTRNTTSLLLITTLIAISGCTSQTNQEGLSRPATTIYAATPGTYDLSTKTVTGNFNLDASRANGDVVLIGNNQDGQILTGGSGNDTLQAGTGNTTLNGGTGYTTYKFGTVFGQDVVNNYALGREPKGEIDFISPSINSQKLWFQKNNNDLQIKLIGTPGTITVANWFGPIVGAQVKSVKISNGCAIDERLQYLIDVMSFYADEENFDSSTATQMPTDAKVQRMILEAWHGDGATKFCK
jgi:hypothetical protein